MNADIFFVDLDDLVPVSDPADIAKRIRTWLAARIQSTKAEFHRTNTDVELARVTELVRQRAKDGQPNASFWQEVRLHLDGTKRHGNEEHLF